MTYAIYYPYNEHYEDIEVLTCDKNEEFDEFDECGYMVNFVHILGWEPSAATIELIKRYVPDIHVIYIPDLDVYALALRGAGMDRSASLEMAYLINDNYSPIKDSDPFYFDEERKMWLEKLRKDPAGTVDEMLKEIRKGVEHGDV